MNRQGAKAGGEKASGTPKQAAGKTATLEASKPHDLQTLQRALGNQGTQRLVEREQLQHARHKAETEGVTSVSSETQGRIDAQRESGSPLDAATREGVRQATGLDFPGARLHSGPEVDELAHQMHARAFTQGSDVFLGSRGRDQATLTHELTHVAQGRTGPGVVQRAPEGEPVEIEMPPMDISAEKERDAAIAEAEKTVADMDAGEAEQEPQRQVSMQLPGPGEEATYVDKPKQPAPAPHETLDPRTEAIIEGKQIKNDRGDMVNPLGPINSKERAERAWDVAKADEKNRKRKEDTSREGTAIDLIEGAAKEAPLTSSPSTGGEPEPSDLPTLTLPGKTEEKQEPEPFVPQKFSFALTIDHITKEYPNLTAEEVIAELKWRWISIRGYIDIYKKWHQDILANRADHPVVGFIVDLAGRRDPPEIQIWDGLENDLGDVVKAIDLDVNQLRSDFEGKERQREEDEKRADEERIAQGQTSLLKFRGINPRWATRADWEKYMEAHIRGAVQALQTAAHRIEARRKAVFYYKEGTIETTEQAVKRLEQVKSGSKLILSLTPVGRGVGLVRGAVYAGGINAATGGVFEFAGQAGEMAFGDRDEFDFGKIGLNMVKDATVGFIGGLTGGALGRAFGNAVGNVFKTKLGIELSEQALTRVTTYITSPAANIAVSPLTTTVQMTFEWAVGQRKTLTRAELCDAIANNFKPRNLLEAYATAVAGAKVQGAYERSGWTGDITRGQPSPGVTAETTTPAPVAETAAPRATETTAPAPVAETTTAPRPVETPTPVAETTTAPRATETPALVPAPEAPTVAVTEQAPTIAAPPASPAPRAAGRRRTRAQPPPIPEAARRRGPTRRELEVGDQRTTTRAISEDAQPTSRRTEPSDAELAVGDQRTTTRAIDENAQPSGTRRTEPTDAELAVGDSRTTTRAIDENAQPTGTRRTEPTDAELAVGDRRTTTRAIDENAQTSSRRTEPSDAELAVGDSRTTTRAVEEPMGPVYGPIEPGIKPLPEHTVIQDVNARDTASAMKIYDNTVTETRGREAALYRNAETGEYIIVQGNEATASVAPGQGPNTGQAQRWKEILDSGDVGRWELLRHSHPSEPGTGFVAEVNKLPSGAKGDMEVMVRESLDSGGQARTSVIDYNTPNGPRQTRFGFDPSLERPYWIQPPDGAQPLSFKTLEAYHDYLERTFPGEVGVVQVEPWLSGNNPVRLANQSANAAHTTQQMPAQVPDATTQRMPAQGPDATTQRMPAQGPDATTQRMPAQGPDATTHRMPAQGPDATTQRMPAQGPDATTQRMPAQGPDATTQRMPAQGPAQPDIAQRRTEVQPAGERPTERGDAATRPTQRGDAFAATQQMPAQGATQRSTADATTQQMPVAGGTRPAGPVEVVPVQNASDARILMQDWPGDRPLRLLANGEARAAWNRDYGQPGDPPPAWFDPRRGLVVDTDQVRPPAQERGAYHVPTENAYVMFNIESPKEVSNIHRQNEAANAVQGSQSARSLLLDHDTFVRTFEAARGWAPDPPAGFVDQNGRLYVDISRVDVSTQGDVAVAGAPKPTQVMSVATPVGEAPAMPSGPMTPPRAARSGGGDDALATTAPQEPALAPTAPQNPALAPTAPQPDGGQAGRPRLSDTGAMGDSQAGSSVQSAPRAGDSGSQPRINPYGTIRPVERIDDPVHAAQVYANFQNRPPDQRGRVRAMETADFQQAWQLNGAGMDPNRPAPVAWIDSHGNLLIDFDRANLDLGAVPRGPVRQGERITYPEAEPFNQPAPLRGNYRPGEPRGLSREVYSLEEAQRLWTSEVMANREVRVINMEQDVMVDLWQHTYGGQGDAPPLAWVDAQGFLVVDRRRVPFPDAVWAEIARRGPS